MTYDQVVGTKPPHKSWRICASFADESIVKLDAVHPPAVIDVTYVITYT